MPSLRSHPQERKRHEVSSEQIPSCNKRVGTQNGRNQKTRGTKFKVLRQVPTLQEQGIHVRTLDGLVNTKGLGTFAPVLIGLLSGLAEVERSLIQERTLESIQHRRSTGGNLGGRPKTNEAKERLVLRLRDEGCSYRSIREQTGLALSTIRRIIAEQETTA